MPHRSLASYVVLCGAVGGLLGGLIPPAFIMLAVFVLDIRIDLSTGLDWVDSMLYSIGGPASILLVSVYWAALGAVLGSIAGMLAGLAYGLTQQR